MQPMWIKLHLSENEQILIEPNGIAPSFKTWTTKSNSALGREKYGKDTNKKGLLQCWCFSDIILILLSWQICIILSAKSIFFFVFET